MITFVLSGPMRGLPDFNYPQFHEVEQALALWCKADGGPVHGDDGWEILNPARSFDGDQSRPLSEYMAASLNMVLKADYVVLLPGWVFSEGAKAEIELAKVLDKKFMRAIGTDIDFKTGEITWDFEMIAGYPDEPVEKTVGKRKFGDPSPWAIPPNAVRSAAGLTEKPTGRTFDTGAYRDTENGKLDYEGFLSPLVLERYAQYMHEHRRQSNGEMRGSDNWQKGIPQDVYMKSMWRHFMDVWSAHRNVERETPPQMDALMALLFNVMGYAFELLREPEGF